MNRLVVVRLSEQSLGGGYQTITEIGNEGAASDIEIQGSLPKLPQNFLEEIEEWRGAFVRLDVNTRLKVKKIPIDNDKFYHYHSLKGIKDSKYLASHIENLAESLKTKINQWLRSGGFQETLQKLRSENKFSDNIQIIIRTNDVKVFSLPWNSWDFLDFFKNASIAFSSSNESHVPIASRYPGRLEGLKVLAIMGDNEGIDLDQDLAIIKNSNNPDIFVRPLLQPNSEILRRELERGCWDILFFSGHSETIDGKGILYLGHGESIFLSELRNSLKKAISGGLKLAIFNSCDGIGLAKDIQDLQIPQVIVMREPISDKVAHIFLAAYIEGIQELDSNSPLYLAERYARTKLASRLTCADWLPIIFQNHKVSSPVKGILRKSSYSSSSRPDPYEDIRKSLRTTLETNSKTCRVIQPISKDSVGEIQYLGALWKARLFPVSAYEGNDIIFFPGDEVCVVARKGNLCFIAHPQVLKNNRYLREIKRAINKDWQYDRNLEMPGFKMHLIMCLFMSLFGVAAISYLSNEAVVNDLGAIILFDGSGNESIESP